MNASFAVLGLVAVFSLPAVAASSGTVSGTILGLDCRDDPYVRMGYDPNAIVGERRSFPDNGNTPLQEIQVRVMAGNDQGQAVWRYGRTNSAGQFSIPWTTNAEMTFVAVTVMGRRPNIASTTVTSTEPSNQFATVTQGITINMSTRTLSVAAGSGVSNTTANFTFISCADSVDAYYTVREVYDLFDVQGPPAVGGTTRSDMLDIRIEVGWPGGTGGGTPTDSEIFLGSGTPNNLPETVAHEVGHLLAWRSLDQNVALINGTSDYNQCFDQHSGTSFWFMFSHECDKAAFHEGLADAVSAFWLWHENARPGGSPPKFLSDPTGTLPSLEAAGTCDDGGAVDHRKPFCNTRALWDLYDNPTSDDDVVTTRDLSDIVTALRTYPRFCVYPWDNNCANEGWPWGAGGAGNDPHGNNWKDFRVNWTAAISGSGMAAIETAAGLGSAASD